MLLQLLPELALELPVSLQVWISYHFSDDSALLPLKANSLKLARCLVPVLLVELYHLQKMCVGVGWVEEQTRTNRRSYIELHKDGTQWPLLLQMGLYLPRVSAAPHRS